VIVTVMAFLFFWGIGRVPLAQAIALTFIAPLIALMLAAPFLHEKIGRKSIVGSIAAFAGVLVIVLGQARAELAPRSLLGSVAIIGSALCYACNIVLMRHQALAARPLRDHLLPVADGARPLAGRHSIRRLPALPDGLLVDVDRDCGGNVDVRAMLFAWGYARAEVELPRGDGI
jgi:S-adenosylmethionine uptake transporter